MQRPGWAPDSIDLERPSVARMYDYFLGGSHNFATDREAAHQIVAIMPEVPLRAQANRAFLRRAVRRLARAGVRQFLDIGSGIPTVGNVHEVAEQEAPGSRVVYADVDPVAVAHSQELLAGNARAAVIQADLLAPDRILAHPTVRDLLDLREPVAVLLVAVLHFIPDAEQPHAAVAAIRDALAPGSYLALTHADVTGVESGDVAAGRKVYERSDSSFFPRGTGEVARFFDGFTLLEPGLVWVQRWHPDPGTVPSPAEQQIMLGGMGRLGNGEPAPGGTGRPGG